MAYISTWDDIYNIDSFNYIIRLCKKKNIDIPLTIFIETYPLYKETVINNEECLKNKAYENKLWNKDNYIEKYKSLLKDSNHTIESHSITHLWPVTYLGKRGGISESFEYIESQKMIRDIFGSNYAKTLCYPKGQIPSNTNIKKIIKQNYIAARSGRRGFFKKGDDLMVLKCYPIEKVKDKIIRTAIQKGYVLITYGHGIKGIGGWHPIGRTRLLEVFGSLYNYKSDIWFTTLPTLIEYLKKTKQI